MTDNEHLFGLYDDEWLAGSVEEVAERVWDDGHKPPVLIHEYTSKPLRSFVRVDHIIDHIIEYDLEEYHDDAGHSVDHLEGRAKDPEVIAAFDAALDLLFKGVGWRWADEHVATWTVTWDTENTSAQDVAPEFHYERGEKQR
jgi:hypothetical protein